MEITLSLPHVTPSHGESPQGSSDCPQDGGVFCHWSINARSTEPATKLPGSFDLPTWGKSHFLL